MVLTPSSPPALDAALALYFDWHALRGSSARHQVDIGRMLRRFAAAAGSDRPVCQITRDDCSSFLKAIQDQGGKPNTVRAYHRVLDAFFNWLVAEERIS